jgi:peptide/nickel transport system permease protein
VSTGYEQSAPAEAVTAEDFVRRGRPNFWLDALRNLIKRHPFDFFFSGGILVIMITAALTAPWIEGADPAFQDANAVSSSPSLDHPFGTDNIGRDVFSRTVHGARVSLTVGFAAVGLGILAATVIGLISGYSGRWVDVIIQRLVDMMMAFPTLILILLVVAIFGASKQNVIFAIALFIIAAPSRVVRAEVLSVKGRQYIEAARSVGCSNLRIMLTHILPNVVHVIIIMVSINIGGVIITEASLSFLGLGVPPPAPSWGNMIAGPGTFYLRNAPWMVIAPGVALALTVYAFNMLGDALRDVLDPRLRV